MKILFFEWPCYGAENWKRALLSLGYQVDCIKAAAPTDDDDREIKEKIKKMVLDNQYDALCSFNFFPLLSAAVKQTDCNYIAWVYDSPSLLLYSQELFNPCNYVFLFDKVVYEKFKKKGINTVYHLPLAGNEAFVLPERKVYSSDVTFLGCLYKEKNFYDKIAYLPEKLRGYLAGIIEAQLRVYGYYMIPELLTAERMDEIQKYVNLDLGPGYWIEKKDIFAALFISQKIANMERERLLTGLAEYFKIQLYSTDTLDYNNIINCGAVSYGEEMYRIFNGSRININMSLRCIESGINLRIMDILSAGGFCITNYQAEIEEHFEIGTDLAVYENEQDLIEKVAYYLEHEDIREEIAHSGRKKIEEKYNYQKKVKKMMDAVKGGKEKDKDERREFEKFTRH